MARCAASISAWGGRKFGMPWARFTPPYWLTTRVISRMTDSVNPWTRREMGTRSPSAPPGDGRHDRHLVAVLQRGRLVVEEPDVFLVHVDVDETAQLASLIDQTLTQSGKLMLEVADHVPDRVALGLDVGVALGDGPERRRNAHGHRHAMVSYKRRFFSLNTHHRSKSTLGCRHSVRD